MFSGRHIDEHRCLLRHRNPILALGAACAVFCGGCSLFGGGETAGVAAGRSEVYDEIASAIKNVEAHPEFPQTPESVKVEIVAIRENAEANASAETRSAIGSKVEAIGSAASKLPGIGGVIGGIVGLIGGVLILTGKKKPLSGRSDGKSS